MNKIIKVFFWIIIIGVGFVNPLISIVLVVLYYLPKIFQDVYKSKKIVEASDMKSFSEDILENMK